MAQKLPGCQYEMDDMSGTPCVYLHDSIKTYLHGRAPTLPRALLAAVLRAVAARGEG